MSLDPMYLILLSNSTHTHDLDENGLSTDRVVDGGMYTFYDHLLSFTNYHVYRYT